MFTLTTIGFLLTALNEAVLDADRRAHRGRGLGAANVADAEIDATDHLIVLTNDEQADRLTDKYHLKQGR